MYSPQGRAERIIAAGRVVLAASSLFAVWLDPSEPRKYAEIAYSLLAAYLIYACVIALLVWRSAVPLERQGLVTHLFDLGFFSVFIYFTAGPASPFTAYFVFSMVCATLRWPGRGTLWTAVAALGMFVLMGIYFVEVVEDPAFHLHRFIIRAVYLAVVAVLLGYLGAHERRAREEISMLAAWPRHDVREIRTLTRELLEWSATLLRTPNALLAWKEHEEPGLFTAAWRDTRFEWKRLAPGTWEPPVHADLRRSNFLCSDLSSVDPDVLRLDGSSIGSWRGAPLHPDLRAMLGSRSVLSVPLAGETVEGRAFFADHPTMTSDDLALGRIVGGVLATRLDQHYLALRLRESAATEERIRLARDLHDGVLQSLAGIALRLSALQRELGASAAAREALDEVRRIVTLEQRDLRFFIEDLKPAPLDPEGRPRTLAERLNDLTVRLEAEWNLRVAIDLAASDQPIGDRLAREIYLLIREALINAARHGKATRVSVALRDGSGDAVALTVADDGGGLPVHGRYSLDALIRDDRGPRSLRERVAALGGALTLDSSPSGLRLEIQLPRAEAGEPKWA